MSMENHPLLQELLEICNGNNLETAKAHLTFESYIELIQVKKLHEVEYGFNQTLKMFYLTGKKDEREECEVYVPVLLEDDASVQDMETWQKHFNPKNLKLNLLIRDRDSSSTCYQITKGLVKPDEFTDNRQKKFLYSQFERKLASHKKSLYMKALQSEKDGDT